MASAPSELRTLPSAYVWDHQVKGDSQASFPAIKLGTDTSVTMKEEFAWAGYEDDVIPAQKQGRRVRHLRPSSSSLYLYPISALVRCRFHDQHGNFYTVMFSKC